MEIRNADDNQKNKVINTKISITIQGELLMKTKHLTTSATIGFFALLLMITPANVLGQTTQVSKPPLQISNRTHIQLLVQVNSSTTMPNGISKQVMAVKNLYDQYTNLGMKPGRDYNILMVFRADGAQFLLKDKAYDLKVKKSHPKGNPSKAIIEELHQHGVKMYECHVAMELKGYKPADIFPFARVVVTGIGAVVDFEKSGYMLVTP